MNRMHDIIVVGAGPAGSRAAFRLAEQGHRVLVLERNPQPGGKIACAGIIGRECADVFDVDESVILKTVNGASLFSPSGEVIRVRREEPQACILDRTAFDISMAERAREAGAEFRFNSRVTGIAIEKDRAGVTFQSPGGEAALSARAAVIACGFSPGLIARLGLGTFRDFTIGVQAEVAAPGVDEVAVYFGDVSPKFFGWIVPTTGGKARVGLLSRDRAGEKLKAWLKTLAEEGSIASPDVRIHYGGIPLRPLRRTYRERLLVVGDAAGQVKPTSGGGIYYGLLGADIAAATLHRAIIRDDFSAGKLARYQRDWRRRLGREIRTGYWARRIYERLSYRRVDRTFVWLRRSGTDAALLRAGDVTFDWHSRALIRLLRYRFTSVIGRVFRLPFPRRNRLTGKADNH